MLEAGKPATPEVVKHIDRCLSCLSCMTTCPSGVHYMHLVDHGRAYIEATYRRPWHDRLLRVGARPACCRIRGASAPRSSRRDAGEAASARWSRRCRTSASVSPPCSISRRARLPPRSPFAHPGVFAPEGARRGRVALLSGCAQPVLQPGINDAAIRLLTRHGVEVVLPQGEGCCGALVHHMGRDARATLSPRRNIDAWIAEMDGAGLDAIVITASGCGTTIKDYGFMFRDDPAYADKARRVSAIAKDVTEYLAASELCRLCATATSSSPTIPPARCSTASRSAIEPKASSSRRGSR